MVNDKKLAVKYAAMLRDDAAFRSMAIQAVRTVNVEWFFTKLVESVAFREELFKLTQMDPAVHAALEQYLKAHQASETG